MTQAKPRPDEFGRTTTRSFRQSFLTACTSWIGERLSAATDDVGQEAAESATRAEALLVLAFRDDAVRDAFEKQFPNRPTSRRPSTTGRAGAWGRATTDRAALHGRQAVAHKRIQQPPRRFLHSHRHSM